MTQGIETDILLELRNILVPGPIEPRSGLGSRSCLREHRDVGTRGQAMTAPIGPRRNLRATREPRNPSTGEPTGNRTEEPTAAEKEPAMPDEKKPRPDRKGPPPPIIPGRPQNAVP